MSTPNSALTFASVCASSHCASSPRQAATLADMRQIRGLVTPRGRFRLEVARQQIRRIGLQQQTFRRDRRQQLAQLQSPPLIAYPTGNTDKQAQIRAFLHLAAAAGKAVQHRARELLAVV